MSAARVGLAVFVWATAAHAYRPFDGTDADVAKLGEIELEIGPIGYLRASHDTALVIPALIANLGFLPRWELVVEGTGVFGLTSRPPSFVSGGIFAKHVLREGTLQGKTGLSLAMEPGILVPTAGAPQTVDDFGVYLGFITSYAWRGLAVHLNTDIARAIDAKPDLFIGTIIEAVPYARVRPVMEVYVDRHGSDTTPSVLVGFIARASEHLSFDVASRLAWFRDAPAFEARGGLTWSFAVR